MNQKLCLLYIIGTRSSNHGRAFLHSASYPRNCELTTYDARRSRHHTCRRLGGIIVFLRARRRPALLREVV